MDINDKMYVRKSYKNYDQNRLIVISADIINSKKYAVEDLDEILEIKLGELNESIKKNLDIDRKFYKSRGDEIQIILPLSIKSFGVLLLTLCYLRPLKLRYGIGIGEYKGQFEENSWDMNGQIFVYARNQLDKLKKSKKYAGLIESGDKEVDEMCNLILSVTNVLVNKITDKQWEAIKYPLLLMDATVAIEELGISSASYYERLSLSNIYEIVEGFDAIWDVLKFRRVIE